jgi:uncharacterized membrane protein YphA (DoxX/SURF4 family)
MGKRLALLTIRLFVSVNLLYAAIFLKFAGVPGSVALFAQMSQTVHGLVSQPVFRLGSGVFETVVAVLLLIPKTARLAAGLTVVWMSAVILSHIFVLGYGWFFVDALMVMMLAVIYLLLTRRHSHRVGAELPYKPIRFEDQARVLLDANVPAFSFIYGIPPKEILDEARKRGIVMLGTATTPNEAIELEQAGVDVVVASGFEAGGHRGSFLRSAQTRSREPSHLCRRP